ncbi:hypothetical protein HDU96_010507 [Phlyctochytrium bullatum]|nr:hypothetical protein HDU96_010507 [Phlyctochytrium bullatum]
MGSAGALHGDEPNLPKEVELALVEREFRTRVRSEARMRAKDQLNNETQATRPVDPENPCYRGRSPATSPRNSRSSSWTSRGKARGWYPTPSPSSRPLTRPSGMVTVSFGRLLGHSTKTKHKPPTMLDVEDVRVPMTELRATLNMAEIAICEVDTFKKYVSHDVHSDKLDRNYPYHPHDTELYVDAFKTFMGGWDAWLKLQMEDRYLEWENMRSDSLFGVDPGGANAEHDNGARDDEMWEAYLPSADDASEGADGGGGGRGGGQA